MKSPSSLLFASNVVETNHAKYSAEQKNSLHAFGYNSAKSELIDLDEIWDSVSQMVWLALAAFGRDPRSSDSRPTLRGSRNFLVMRMTHDFTISRRTNFTKFERNNVDK